MACTNLNKIQVKQIIKAFKTKLCLALSFKRSKIAEDSVLALLDDIVAGTHTTQVYVIAGTIF